MMESSVKQLKTMFPAIDEESIRVVLKHCQNDVNKAIEKLLTFSEDTHKELSPVQKETTATSNLVEKRSHITQQYQWMNLPPLNSAQQDSLNEMPIINLSPPQWVYPQPYPLYRHVAQPVAIGNQPQVIPSLAGSNPVPIQPTMRQHWPRQPQTVLTHQHVVPVKKQLVIMRGLPGSGKSTLAKKLKGQSGVIFSTDDFFLVNGMYQFDASKRGEYHEKNQRRAKDAMLQDISPIIIDNTNTKCYEMKPYVAAALQFNYNVEFREPDTPWKFNLNTLVRKNIHGVNKTILERMLERYEHHVTVDMVMGTNKNSSKPTLPNR